MARSAGMPSLPNEILAAIFARLEPATLAQLTTVSRHLNAVAEYHLYSLISFTDVLTDAVHVPQRTVSWCHAMLNRPHLADAVKRLQIRWTTEYHSPPTPLLLAVCDQLSLVIRSFVGLEYLDLFLGPANFASLPRENMHAIERAVFLCSLPALRYCSFGADYAKGIQPYTAHIVSFLSHTPSLQHLRLADHYASLNLPLGSLNLPLGSHVLPLLHTFRGSAATAATILPGRPVRYLSLVGQDSDVTQENLLRMASTSTPLRYLDLSAISARPVLLRSVSSYLPTLERLRIRLALRHTLHYALSGISLLVGLSSVLSKFPNLVYLDLSPTLEGGRANPADERVLCTEYGRACPSIRTIVFPSQAEWFLDNEGQWCMTES